MESASQSGRLGTRPVLVWMLLVIVALGGGSSSPQALSLIYLRPLIIIVATAALFTSNRMASDLRPLFAILLLSLAWCAIQLIPLPPALAAQLPGHEFIANVDSVAGLSGVWRPVSISPDLTLNALVSIACAIAMLVTIGGFDPARRSQYILPLLALVGMNVVAGVIQVSAGGDAYRLYNRSHEDAAVGLFANRNHYALLLSAGFPLLAAWYIAGQGGGKVKALSDRGPVASIAVLVLLVLIIVTGSRAGLALGVVGLMAGGWIVWRNRQGTTTGSSETNARRKVAMLALVVVVAAAILSATVTLKGVAVDRVFASSGDLSTEDRLRFAPLVLSAIVSYFPFGSGFGTFDPVFRRMEPDAALNPKYFNHAHNDFLELLLTGGLPALLILVIFVGYIAKLTIRGLRQPPGHAAAACQAGAAVMWMALAASLVDYPLRTPVLAAVVILSLSMASSAISREPKHNP